MLKKVVTPLLKFSVAGVIFYWLWNSGKLDFSSLKDLAAKPGFWIVIGSCWLFGAVTVSGLRWHMLLRQIVPDLKYKHSFSFHLVGLFFNTVMPGAVGGDLIKSIYARKYYPQASQLQILLSAAVDRIFGLFAMFLIAGGVSAFQLMTSKTEDTFLHDLMTSATIAGISVFLGLTLVYTFPKKLLVPVSEFIQNLSTPGSKMIQNLWDGFVLYRGKTSTVLTSMGCSIVAQFTLLSSFYWVATQVGQGTVDFIKVAAIYPIGFLTASLPIAPAGLGVGHAVFERLFSLVQIQGGANIFNTYLIATLSLNLLGIIPYLFLQKPAGLMEEQA